VKDNFSVLGNMESVREDVRKVVSSLSFGDIVQVDWLDASEALNSFEAGGECVDTPVRSLGYFLGLKGKRVLHLVIAKEIVLRPHAYHYNAIPLSMVQNVRVVARCLLEPRVKRGLKKFVWETLSSIRGKAGWKYAGA